jgi:hypothetical protein
MEAMKFPHISSRTTLCITHNAASTMFYETFSRVRETQQMEMNSIKIRSGMLGAQKSLRCCQV